MGVSGNGGPQYGTLNSRILIIRTPKYGTGPELSPVAAQQFHRSGCTGLLHEQSPMPSAPRCVPQRPPKSSPAFLLFSKGSNLMSSMTKKNQCPIPHHRAQTVAAMTMAQLETYDEPEKICKSKLQAESVAAAPNFRKLPYCRKS